MTQASIAFFALKATTTGTFLIIDDDGSASIHTVALGACPVKAAAAGDAYLCGAGYSAASSPDIAAGAGNIAAYLESPGAHYAVFVDGDLDGAQLAQAAVDETPAGSFACIAPASAKPIMGAVGKQMLADTDGWLYPATSRTARRSGTRRTRLASGPAYTGCERLRRYPALI